MEDVYFILEDSSFKNLRNYKCCTGICTFLWIMGQCFRVQMLCSAIYYNPFSAHYKSLVHRYVHYGSFTLLYQYS